MRDEINYKFEFECRRSEGLIGSTLDPELPVPGTSQEETKSGKRKQETGRYWGIVQAAREKGTAAVGAVKHGKCMPRPRPGQSHARDLHDSGSDLRQVNLESRVGFREWGVHNILPLGFGFTLKEEEHKQERALIGQLQLRLQTTSGEGNGCSRVGKGRELRGCERKKKTNRDGD
ncbi:hypothetical protein B0H13DRAFT_1876974 [Mycena leptocephala]|nr:hypothetical protein B0H13DRAFT_1876974 [Mycena leptocephala]